MKRHMHVDGYTRETKANRCLKLIPSPGLCFDTIGGIALLASLLFCLSKYPLLLQSSERWEAMRLWTMQGWCRNTNCKFMRARDFRDKDCCVSVEKLLWCQLILERAREHINPQHLFVPPVLLYPKWDTRIFMRSCAVCISPHTPL